MQMPGCATGADEAFPLSHIRAHPVLKLADKGDFAVLSEAHPQASGLQLVLLLRMVARAIGNEQLPCTRLTLPYARYGTNAKTMCLEVGAL